MRKFMVIAIPVVTSALFILVMLSGNFLKKPLGKDDNIPGAIIAKHKAGALIELNEAYEHWDELGN